MTETVEFARAKINLFLEVLGKRGDGYHEIESVMAAVDFGDDVVISLTESGISVECDTLECERTGDIDALDEKENLAYKAAEAFFARLDERSISHGGVSVKIKKRIPVRSGLAGGSADAAAVLRGMNNLFGGVFDTKELCEAASKLGADVPFCVVGGVAVCRGTGDEMSAVESGIALHGVITVEKDEKLSTAAAYSLVDDYNENKKKELMFSDDTVRALELGDAERLSKSLFNIFEKACCYGSRAKEIMLEAGAENAVLSGAGPAFFMLTDDGALAQKTADALLDEGYPAYIF